MTDQDTIVSSPPKKKVARTAKKITAPTKKESQTRPPLAKSHRPAVVSPAPKKERSRRTLNYLLRSSKEEIDKQEGRLLVIDRVDSDVMVLSPPYLDIQNPRIVETVSVRRNNATSIQHSLKVQAKRPPLEKLIPRLEILSEQLNKPDLWDDPARAGKISREHGSIMGKMKEVNAFEQELFEHIDMIKLAREDNDAELELTWPNGTETGSPKALLQLRTHIKEKELEALLAGEQDPCSCFIEVQAGAGGTESMDWASMVMQMYIKWAEGRGFGVTVVDEMPGEMAGIKRATIKVDGEYAFGYAKAEVGAHRLVRISPFDSNKRRHTSFASVAVIPILSDGYSRVQINESDLKIERYRAGGPGGQHANTTESAVRITHIPTGITATCQNERSQHQNKASAMAVLQSRLDHLETERQAQINAEHTVSLTDINFGSQIRSYVLHPYRMVKDHRTDYEVSDPDSVLQGDLDGFILSFLSASLDKNKDEDL
ncbi:hypothetical protein DH2020_045169 [Rehmannia glutinosa]|uniref:Peptide chain release factor domain-containing protein n=1 Tax=Rehmannia glutinosa TaxID=99300 RepID=A0ABR0UGI6_REHGL